MERISIKKNIFYNTLRICSSIVFPMIVSPYVLRILQPENIGKIDFSIVYVGYFSLIASLGIHTYAIRECAVRRSDKAAFNHFASEIFSINVFSTLIAYTMLFLVLLCFGKLHVYATLILIQSISIAFSTMGAEWINLAMEDFQYLTIRTIVFQLLSLIAILVFVREPDDYYMYAIISVLSGVLTNFANYFYRKGYCKIRFILNNNWKKHLSHIMILFVMMLVQSIYQKIDVTMLGIMKGDYEVGLYSTASKICALIGQPVYSVFWVVFPRLSLYFEKKEEENRIKLLKMVFNLTMLLGLPCCIGGILLSKQIMHLCGGSAYLQASKTLQILLISMFFNLFSGFVGNMVLIPAKQENYFMKACCGCAIFNVVANFIMIPQFGMNGAGWATVASTVFMIIVLAMKAKRYMSVDSEMIKNLVQPLAGCIGIACFCMLMKDLNDDLIMSTVICFAGSFVIYFSAMILMREPLTLYGLSTVRNKISGIIRKK